MLLNVHPGDRDAVTFHPLRYDRVSVKLHHHEFFEMTIESLKVIGTLL
jgi:hypothetical protein